MGIDPEGPGPGWDGHVALLHRTEDEHLAGLTAWVRRGLNLGERVLCTEFPRTPADSLLAVLEARGVAVAGAVRDGQFTVLPAEDFYPPEGQTALVERALAEGFPGVRLAGEARAALTMLSRAAYQRLEQQMAEFMRTRPVSALCPYPAAMTARAWLEDIVAVHLFGVRQSTFATSQDLDGLALHGEVESANADVFTAVLTVASRRRSRVLWLDLAAVTHFDAGSGWRLEDATRRFRAAGGHVLVVAPSPEVEHILRLLEIDQVPGVHLLGGQP